MDNIQTHGSSMRGVEPKRWIKTHPYGHPNILYHETACEVNGQSYNYYPDHGDDPALAASRMKTAVQRYGLRERHIIPAYVTWHGHTRVKLDGSLATDPHVPMWVGVSLLGDVWFLFRDGSSQIQFRIPLKTYANDFTYYEPREANIFFVVDTDAGEILKIDRGTLEASLFHKGFKRATSIRAVGQTLYVCDPETNGGSVWAVDVAAPEVARHVCNIEKAYWVDYTSTGKLVVTTQNRSTYIVDPATGTMSNDLMEGKLAGDQKWVQCDVDRNGTCGRKDSILVLSSHGEANTDVYRLICQSEGVWGKPGTWGYGRGNCSVGYVEHTLDAVGHYPWSANHHPDDGVILFQGFANGQPGYLVAQNPADPWPVFEDHNDEMIDLFWVGRRVIEWGGDPEFKGTVPSFQSIVNWQGGSQLGSADYIAELPFAEAVAYLRGGMCGTVQRTITGDNLKGLMYFIHRSSQRYLREGKSLIDNLFAYLKANP